MLVAPWRLSLHAYLNVLDIALLAVVPGCSDSGKPVLFILPNDFKGEFRIVKDATRGADLAERNGEWVFEFPARGVLKVKNDRPFYRWHSERARYADGRPVVVDGIGTLAGSRPTGPNSTESSTDLNGTTHIWRVR
jgi:hypothetical protein